MIFSHDRLTLLDRYSPEKGLLLTSSQRHGWFPLPEDASTAAAESTGDKMDQLTKLKGGELFLGERVHVRSWIQTG